MQGFDLQNAGFSLYLAGTELFSALGLHRTQEKFVLPRAVSDTMGFHCTQEKYVLPRAVSDTMGLHRTHVSSKRSAHSRSVGEKEKTFRKEIKRKKIYFFF